MSSLRVGIFGLGRMGAIRLESALRLSKLGHLPIKVVAGGDRHAPNLARIQSSVQSSFPDQANEIRFFDTPQAMLDGSGGLDCVIVSSQTQDHARDTLLFADTAQLPTLVEKPFASNMTEANEVLARLGGKNKVQVGFQRRWDPISNAAQDWLHSGKIGKLQQLHHVLQDKNPTPPSYQSSGLTSDMAIHLVYEALMCKNHEMPVQIQSFNFKAPHYEDLAGEGANVTHSMMVFDDGVLAHTWGSRLNHMGYDNQYIATGTEGRIDVGGFIGDFGDVTAHLYQNRKLSRTLTQPMDREIDFAPADYFPRFSRAFDEELKGFVKAIQDKTAFLVDEQDGWRTLFLANLAEASSRRGVRFDLDVRTIEDANKFIVDHSLEGTV